MSECGCECGYVLLRRLEREEREFLRKKDPAFARVQDLYELAQYVIGYDGGVDTRRRDYAAKSMELEHGLPSDEAYRLVDKAIEKILASRPKPSFWRRLFGGR